MRLGKVVGSVWATKKDPKIEGLKFLIIREIDTDYNFKENFVIAADTVGAGSDEIVLIAEGSSARQTDRTKDKPIDAVVMAIVDEFEVTEK